MKLKAVQIENYRAIRSLTLNLDPQLTVLHGANGCGKTSILTAIALAFAPSSSYFRAAIFATTDRSAAYHSTNESSNWNVRRLRMD